MLPAPLEVSHHTSYRVIQVKEDESREIQGLTKGTVLAYALEYNDEKGICFFTDFLVVGENQQTFDLEGDSGSLIVMKGENDEKPRPIGIIRTSHPTAYPIRRSCWS
ncbi:hypothetical protein Tco_0449762 [Tanacetum coccineum]